MVRCWQAAKAPRSSRRFPSHQVMAHHGAFPHKKLGPKSSNYISLFEVLRISGCFSGKKKAHKHKLFGPVALGTTPGLSLGQTRFVPGTNPGCPRDKPRFSSYFTQWKPSLSLGQARFVPGTNPVCPWDKPVANGGRRSLGVQSLCAKFAP